MTNVLLTEVLRALSSLGAVTAFIVCLWRTTVDQLLPVTDILGKFDGDESGFESYMSLLEVDLS